MNPPLPEAYLLMRRHAGHQRWWPGETPLEICLGAILTQNTNWQNVERAINALKANRVLNLPDLQSLPVETLAEFIRPAGYFNVKARRLKAFFAAVFHRHHGSLDSLLRQDTAVLRRELLAIKGIGPETADSMLLYAGNHPSFVVDAYTMRIFARHRWIDAEADYDSVKKLCETALAAASDVIDYWQDFHAQIVHVGKHYCRKKTPLCDLCPLNGLLPDDDRPPAAVSPDRP